MNKWDKRFIKLAEHIAAWSKDPSTKVGAVLVRPDRTIASVGYNGFPRGTADEYTTRADKLMRTIHAEMNALLSCREEVDGYTLYVSPLFPCSNCAAAIIQSGVKTVVATMGEVRIDWQQSFFVAKEMFEQAGVKFTIVQKEEEDGGSI
jgi:dCMP deaminase